MTESDFSGRGDALLTEPLRAYRSWTVDVSLTRLVRGQYRKVDGLRQQRLDLLRELYRKTSPGAVGSGSSAQWWATWREAMELEPDATRFGAAVPAPTGTLMPDGKDVVTSVQLRPVTQLTSGYWSRTRDATCVVAQRTVDLLDGDDVMDPDHVAPVLNCTCGIYGWYRPWEARREHTGSITGTIKVEGDVILGSRGLRAQRATVEALTVNPLHEHAFAPVDRATLLDALRFETREGSPLEGVVICDTEAELRDRFPADLDTLRNLVGAGPVDALEYGDDAGSTPVFSAGNPHTGAQLMAGPWYGYAQQYVYDFWARAREDANDVSWSLSAVARSWLDRRHRGNGPKNGA